MVSKTFIGCVFMLVATAIALAPSPQCVEDIEKASDELVEATANLVAAGKDCATNATQCSIDILSAVSHLSNATTEITKAVGDCGGTSDACTTDIETISTGLANATLDITKAVKACSAPVQKFQCARDVTMGTLAVTKVGLAIAHAVKDCGGNFTKY